MSDEKEEKWAIVNTNSLGSVRLFETFSRSIADNVVEVANARFAADGLDTRAHIVRTASHRDFGVKR